MEILLVRESLFEEKVASEEQELIRRVVLVDNSESTRRCSKVTLGTSGKYWLRILRPVNNARDAAVWSVPLISATRGWLLFVVVRCGQSQSNSVWHVC